jgi:hypothetical protein
MSFRCEKKYLYPSSLKKHYTVSHREEYEKYLEDKDSKYSSSNFLIVKTVGYNTIKELHPESLAPS